MKKTSPYRICLICWLGALSIAIAIGLGYYFDFLVDYENVYQSSRPFHKMDEIMLSFEQMDMDTVYNWISQKPEINAFETEENVKNYMRRLLADATFSYAETDNSFEERPEYYIFANDYIIAKLSLKKRTNEYLPYGFPIWDIFDFEFYTQSDYEFILMEFLCPTIIAISGLSSSMNAVMWRITPPCRPTGNTGWTDFTRSHP